MAITAALKRLRIAWSAAFEGCSARTIPQHFEVPERLPLCAAAKPRDVCNRQRQRARNV